MFFTVLIVDDDPANIRLLSSLLREKYKIPTYERINSYVTRGYSNMWVDLTDEWRGREVETYSDPSCSLPG